MVKSLSPSLLLLLLLSLLVPLACTKKLSVPSAPAPAPAPTQTSAEMGKKIYTTHCIACHSPDPHQDGAVGPAIAGSSLDLLQSRVLKTEYPVGYKAKRTTHIMPPLPYLKDNIPALHAYLNSP